MAQELRTLDILAKDLSSVPRIYRRVHNELIIAVLQDLVPSPGFLGHCMRVVHIKIIESLKIKSTYLIMPSLCGTGIGKMYALCMLHKCYIQSL